MSPLFLAKRQHSGMTFALRWVKWGSTKRASSCLKTSKVVEKLRKIWKNVWKSEKKV